MTVTDLSPMEPATVVVTAKPVAGREPEWEQALGDLIRQSLAFPGHLGSTVLRPEIPGEGYRIITKFDSNDHMKNWQDSDIRHQCVGKLRDMESEPANIVNLSGMETWYDQPGTPKTSHAPSKFKMATLVWIALFFVVVPAMGFLAEVTGNISPVYGKMIRVTFGVVLMVWIVMPLLNRLFGFWLYPKK